MKVKVTQSCPALCDPVDYTVPGILQARISTWAQYKYKAPLSEGDRRVRIREEM